MTQRMTRWTAGALLALMLTFGMAAGASQLQSAAAEQPTTAPVQMIADPGGSCGNG